MIKIVPDKEGRLTQWDLNRKIIVTGYEGVAEVHFASPGDDHGAYVVELVDGEAEIPNILLTMAGTINVYVYPADRTVFATALWVMAREKPDDYIYTETEVLSYKTLDEKIGDLTELTTIAKENLVAAINEAATVSGGGMSQALRVAIYNLLMDAAYQSSGHESDKAALEELLTGSSGGGESGGEVIYYTIEKTLTNVSISNGAASVAAGSTYSATLTADEGYTLDSVTVTMGGEAIAVTDGVIEIASVTGNIVITATATAEETGGYEWTSGTAYDFSNKIIENATLDSSTGVEVVSDGNSCTDYINCFDVDYFALSINGGSYWFYDASKNFIGKVGAASNVHHCAVPDGAVFFRTDSTNITVTPVSKSADNYTAGEQAVTWSKGTYDSTGAIVSSSKYISTVFPIAGAATLTLGDSVQATSIVLFDEYQNYVRQYTSQNTPLDLTSINFVPYSFAAVGAWSAATITLT